MAEAQPVFRGTSEEQKIAADMFGLMIMQSRSYAADAPIKQSLHNFAAFFVDKGVRPSSEEAAALIESAVKANPHVFHRYEDGEEVQYVTSKRGQAVRPAQAGPIRYMPPAAPAPAAPVAPAKRAGAPVVITRATLMTPAMQGSMGSRSVLEDAGLLRSFGKPTIIRREEPAKLTSDDLAKLAEAVEATEAVEEPVEPAVEPVTMVSDIGVVEPIVESVPQPAALRPMFATSAGQAVYMDGTPEEILDAARPDLLKLVGEALSADSRFVSFGDDWMLEELVTNISKPDLRRIHAAIEDSGDVVLDTTLLTDLLGKNAEDADFEVSRFSLNLALLREKRVFDFRGTNQERYWGVLGMVPPREARSVLRPSEIGQDFKFLEDEAPRTDEGAGRWVHSLTFYEIENGFLPYSATAKLVMPKPLLKEQRVALLEFRAIQLGLTVMAELHYPGGNRGGWVEGLEEILDHFIPGARIVIEGTERDNQFLISYRKSEPRELDSVRYEEKKRRFVFSPATVEYQVDESMLITRARFKNLANALRLEENARRKGDQVISFAFTKVGSRVSEEESSAYRASLSDLLPVVNLEKPFSRASLLRFMTTHPHYQKDEAEEGVYLYKIED